MRKDRLHNLANGLNTQGNSFWLNYVSHLNPI
jgi:hypothetical protein